MIAANFHNFDSNSKYLMFLDWFRIFLLLIQRRKMKLETWSLFRVNTMPETREHLRIKKIFFFLWA